LALHAATTFDPPPADLAPAAGVGRANAWTKGADGVVVGLVEYPGGKMPAVFVSGVTGLAMDDVVVEPLEDFAAA
jgi:hypothetical protein